MHATVSPPEKTRRPHLFTVEDFHQLSEIGVLGPEHERIELIDGKLLEPMAVGSKHAGIVNFLAKFIERQVGEKIIVSNQNPVRLNTYSEPLPDLALLKFKDDFYRTAHPIARDVLLLIEVADSSLAFDLSEKATAYAQAGIGEYWVIDITGEKVHTFTKPAGLEFRSVKTVHRGDRLECELIDGLSVEIDSLFK